MSQESYNRGFEKVARAHVVDPVALAGFRKQAFSWGELKSKIEEVAKKGYGMARDAWHSVPHEYKPLVGAAVGAGGGALGGAALGSLTGLGAGRGALVGAGLGGVGGGLYGANSMAKYLKSNSAEALKAKDKALKGKDKEIAGIKGRHADELLALTGKYEREMADAAAAHLAALQGKDKEMASQAQTLAKYRAKLDVLTRKYTPEQLGKMPQKKRRELLDAISAAQSGLASSGDAIRDVNMRNYFARMGYSPEVIDRIMESEGTSNRLKAYQEASELRAAAQTADASTQAKIQELMKQIQALQSRGRANLLPGIYKSK